MANVIKCIHKMQGELHFCRLTSPMRVGQTTQTLSEAENLNSDSPVRNGKHQIVNHDSGARVQRPALFGLALGLSIKVCSDLLR